MFDIRLNEEQRAFQQVAREFAQEEIKPLALELDSHAQLKKWTLSAQTQC